jgi:hypothetical protein
VLSEAMAGVYTKGQVRYAETKYESGGREAGQKTILPLFRAG